MSRIQYFASLLLVLTGLLFGGAALADDEHAGDAAGSANGDEHAGDSADSHDTDDDDEHAGDEVETDEHAGDAAD